MDDNIDALNEHVEAEKKRKQTISECISEVELAINSTLIALGGWQPELRKVLLEARGNIREAIGEART